MNQKFYAGSPPKAEDGWSHVHTMQADGLAWLVFEKSQEHSDAWATYKICVQGKAQGKANYWMAKNFKTGQIGFASDYVTMRQHRPELCSMLEVFFQGRMVAA